MCIHFLHVSQVLESSPKKLARRLEVEQQEIITTGLESCQTDSDFEYLKIKSEDVMAEINEALAAFNDANHKFLSAKEVSKEKLVESRNRLEAASEEVQGLFQTLQDVREVLWMFSLSITRTRQERKLDEMPVDEVKGELEQVENELEMNLATNRNVIDQYQQRQAQVRMLRYQFTDALSTILLDRTINSRSH
jgi:chromosome segregation ATPase